MALCIRKLDNKAEWDVPRGDEPWLAADDLRADALRDLATDGNKLSIYEVTEEVPLDRILAALAAKRDHAVKLDFIVFDSAILDEVGIASERVRGDTHDAGVNARHLDLIRLTARKLADFGGRIRAARNAERRLDKQVVRLIQTSVDQGLIDFSLLKPSLAAKISAPQR